MKKFLLAGAAVLVAGVMPAHAANMPVRMPVKALPPVVVLYNWTGFYVGINGGYSWGSANTSVTGAAPFTPTCTIFGNRPRGGLGGGQVGYNWQTNTWLWGFEADFQAAGQRD